MYHLMRDNRWKAATPTIMVVDDTITIRKIVETSLRRAGYQVICCPDGISALRWLTQEADQLPGLLLLDIDLPKMDGYAVAQHIRSNPRLSKMGIVQVGHCLDLWSRRGY
jgi:CheY-like chemotaxis protein